MSNFTPPRHSDACEEIEKIAKDALGAPPQEHFRKPDAGREAAIEAACEAAFNYEVPEPEKRWQDQSESDKQFYRGGIRAAITAYEAHRGGRALCSDCPPPDYPTDKTRCSECPMIRRRKMQPVAEVKP